MNYKIKYKVTKNFMLHELEEKETIVTEVVLVTMLKNHFYIISDIEITAELKL